MMTLFHTIVNNIPKIIDKPIILNVFITIQEFKVK